ncbi:MAG: prepilin-type N-terminal cleavage/methylation domain-containing protein [Proteobacteria bacterium]|nr:prepilin-type N-terminal cleavage/methylation domain-containing protein [Pseudomonadota bacterium]MBU1686254.1 prepilin-type N-terminal cleavage/methylation domain-containing protein [Pseudomonadota bacterium]
MRNKGFTLLELMLSMTIMAVIAGICFGVFHLGVRAWEQGETRVIANQRLRIIPELLRRQLASVSLPEWIRRDRRFWFFSGTSRSLEFFSRISLLTQQDEGGALVHYRVRSDSAGRDTLELYEMDLLHLRQLGGDVPVLTDGDFQGLVSGWHSVVFAYLGPEPLNPEDDPWVGEWDSTTRKGIPRAVRVSVQSRAGGGPLVWIIPLAVTRDDG